MASKSRCSVCGSTSERANCPVCGSVLDVLAEIAAAERLADYVGDLVGREPRGPETLSETIARINAQPMLPDRVALPAGVFEDESPAPKKSRRKS